MIVIGNLRTTLVKNGDLQGDADATAILAEFYIHGVGIPEDVWETGIELLEKQLQESVV